MAEESTPKPEQARPPFDKAITEELRQVHREVFARHPEVRSLCTAIDYGGALNDADIDKGVWSAATGNPADKPDVVFGSLFQGLRMLEEQFSHALRLTMRMRDRVQVLATETLRLQKEARGGETPASGT